MKEQGVQLKINAPKRLKGKVSAACAKCDNETEHDLLAAVDKIQNDAIWLVESYEIIRCRGCNEISFRKNWLSDDDMLYDNEKGVFVMVEHPWLYPPRLQGRKPIKNGRELPMRIRGIYDESHQALCSGQRVLASIGIRALVEAVCSEKKAIGRNLEKKIDNLVDLGVLSKSDAEILHGARLLGNKAAHEVEPPTEDQLNAAMDVAEHLLNTVYIIPMVAGKLPGSTKATK